MTNVTNKEETLEILLSTMNRTSLSFLEAMFPANNYLNYNILIINQTTKEMVLKSDFENIRVINSFEKSLPRSRNLAIENALGSICLIADDDVSYKKNFNQFIIEAFEMHDDADIVTFQMVDKADKLYKPYPDIIIHDKKTISTANSVVIAFRRSSLINNKVKFNVNFGLGSIFQIADEYVFLRNALKAKLKLYFEPKILLSHPFFSSGKDNASDQIVFARAALYYKYSGFLGYFRLSKYLYLIYMQNELKFSEIIPKLKMGSKGIKKYKQLLKKGTELR